MSEKQIKDTQHEDMDKKDVIDFWKALGIDNTDDYTNEELAEMISKKINMGDISHEEMEAAIELLQSKIKQ